MKNYFITTYKGTYTLTASRYREALEQLKKLEKHPQVKFIRFKK